MKSFLIFFMSVIIYKNNVQDLKLLKRPILEVNDIKF